MKEEPTVFVVDDDDAVRDSVRTLLSAAGMRVETFGLADEFLARVRPGLAGCIVLDIRMPEKSGLVLQDELLQRGVRLPIIFLTGHADIPIAVQAMKKGALDFIQKPLGERRLVAAVQKGLQRCADLELSLPGTGALSEEVRVRLATLSDRERQVLERVLNGKSAREIADELSISLRTVEFHRANIREKLRVSRSPVDLVKLFLPAEGGGEDA